MHVRSMHRLVSCSMSSLFMSGSVCVRALVAYDSNDLLVCAYERLQVRFPVVC